MQKFFRLMAAMIAVVILAVVVTALDEDLEPATIVNDEGGPVVITGEISYTNAFFTAGVSEPVVILEDQTGFVNRDEDYLFPPESQVLGQITSDFYSSPFSYSLSLPIEPQAPLNDVDNDDEEDTGVMVFQVAYWTNTFEDAFLQERDLFGGGWSGAYASAEVSSDSATAGEYIGGNILIFAPEEGQAFPSGFGEDGMLFTEDDPLVIVPAGYTIVNMDDEVFTFDRSREPVIDLIEGEGAAADDFSSQSYTEAFDSMIEKFRTEYAFTEYYGLDWDAISDEFRPRIEEAEENEDPVEYARVILDFTWAIPDGHIGTNAINFFIDDFFAETDGDIGIAIRELTDGRVITNFVREGSPAAEAGVELGTEILEINGLDVTDAISEAVPWSLPFSTEHTLRLQQMRYAVRFTVGEEVDLTFINADGEEETVTLETVEDREAFNFSSFNVGSTGTELPVQWRLVDNTIVVEITSFLDDERLSILLWERMIQDAQALGVDGIIIDMRNNGGGSGWLADQMAAYFFQEEFELGYGGGYDEAEDEFIMYPEYQQRFYLPPEELRYDGPVAVLVGPNCGSACEFFSYDMTIDGRADIVGQYPTAGLGGSVNQFFMPEGIVVQITVGRQVDPEGNIHIEGIGVVPNVVVPVNEDTLGLTDVTYVEDDPILDYALNHLSGVAEESASEAIIDGGEIGYDEEITGELEVGQRAQYTFTILEDEEVGIYIEGDLDTYLRIYDETGETLLAENDDIAGTLNSGIEAILLDQDLTVIIEVGTFSDGGAGEYTLVTTTGESPFAQELTITDGGEIDYDDEATGEIDAYERVQYTFEAEADTAVNIYIDGDLDTYLRVYDETGEELLDENDDFDGLNSGLEGIEFDEDTTVIIEVGTFGDSDAGEYALRVETEE